MKTARSQLRRSTRPKSASRTWWRGRTKPTVSAEYIAGLTDGEGCFYVRIKPPYNTQGGARVLLNFFIKMQAGDKGLLEKVRNTLHCGAVYFQPETRANHTQCFRYTVSSHRDILAIVIPFFKKHPLHARSKQRSFAIFCAIAQLVQQGGHRTSGGMARVKALKARMNRRTRVVREIRSLCGNAKSP